MILKTRTPAHASALQSSSLLCRVAVSSDELLHLLYSAQPGEYRLRVPKIAAEADPGSCPRSDLEQKALAALPASGLLE